MVGTTDGCVSDTVNITVTVGACQLILNEFSATGCHSYNWNGTVYTTSGDYQQHLYNDLGCDSVVTLHLTIYPNQGVARTVDACGSYTWYQQHFTQSGTYTFAYYDGNGCKVEYGATGFAHGQGSFVYEAAAATASQTLIVIDYLTANTTYDFYVRAICGGNDTSAWSPVTTEKTLCNVISNFPWTETFNNLTAGILIITPMLP